MKIISLLFSQAKKPQFSGLNTAIQSFFRARIQTKDIDLSVGCIHLHYDTGAAATIFAHPGMTDVDADMLQELGANAYKTAKKYLGDKGGQVNLLFDTSRKKQQRYAVEKGILLARNDHQYYKTTTKVAPISLTGISSPDLELIVSGIDRTRELVCKPANIVTPPFLVSYIQQLCTKTNKLTATVFGPKELAKERMNLFLAVSRGAEHDPAMVVIEYTGGNDGKKKGGKARTRAQKPIVLVGKGLCYDSGGLYAKPYPHMNEMHGDMAGAATVIGIMSILAELGINRRVIGVVGLTENLIDEDSYKNGDIYTARNGKTVSVDHTDAEGRLVLADMLSYVSDVYKPARIIDIATLTGACWTALGELYTGIFGYDQKMITTLKEIGETTNDKVWQLPLDRHCLKAVTEGSADLSNTGSRDRLMGASTAAAFLSQFVCDKNKWIHLDIAGPALRDKMRKAYDIPKGVGTGAMVHTIVEWLKKN